MLLKVTALKTCTISMETLKRPKTLSSNIRDNIIKTTKETICLKKLSNTDHIVPLYIFLPISDIFPIRSIPNCYFLQIELQAFFPKIKWKRIQELAAVKL